MQFFLSLSIPQLINSKNCTYKLIYLLIQKLIHLFHFPNVIGFKQFHKVMIWFLFLQLIDL